MLQPHSQTKAPFCNHLSVNCVIPENILSPPPPLPQRRALPSQNPRLLGISILGGACHTPTPWNFRDFPTRLGPPVKNISFKMLLHLTSLRKNFFCQKMRQKISIHINAVSNRHFVIGLFPRASYFMLNIELEKQSQIYGFIY